MKILENFVYGTIKESLRVGGSFVFLPPFKIVPNFVPTTKPYRVIPSDMGTLEHPLMYALVAVVDAQWYTV